ncbi:MAG: hypothetical protein WDA75_15920 [Candidatus Latescibacterota bacterium]|jgi:hypothetical protein
MIPWIFLHDPFEPWLTGYRRLFDAWHDGGVRGIAVGYLRFTGDGGTFLRTFAPDHRVFADYGVAPPPDGPRDLAREKQLNALLDDAAARGWHILVFDVPLRGGDRPPAEDPYGAVGTGAAVQALIRAYPQVHGVIFDGPGERHYELAFHHGGELLEIRPHERLLYGNLGFNLDRMERGITHLRERLHRLRPGQVRFWAPGGALAGLHLLDLTEDALYWLRARRQTSLGWMAAMRAQFDRLDRRIELCGIPRTPAFSSLTCQDYEEMGRLFDLVFPKHYFWHRGFDGLYGTVARWVQVLQAWNPGLSEADGFACVRHLLGIELPGVSSLLDLDLGFPDAFFDTVVAGETRRALEAVGDPERTVAWVSTGRKPHSGDAMTSGDLFRLLDASARAGLQRFLFHPDPDLGVAEWRVITHFCGSLYQENLDGYWPGDTPRLDSFSGGRRPGDR